MWDLIAVQLQGESVEFDVQTQNLFLVSYFFIISELKKFFAGLLNVVPEKWLKHVHRGE